MSEYFKSYYAQRHNEPNGNFAPSTVSDSLYNESV